MKILETIEKYVLYATLFLVPIIVLPTAPNVFEVPKITILTLGVLLVLALMAIRTLISGRFTLSSSNFDFPLLLLAASYIISAIIRAPNKMDAFLFPGTATVLIAGTVLYLLLNQSLAGVEKKGVGIAVFLSGTLAALTSLLSVSGILGRIGFLPAYAKDPAFSIMGGTLPLVIFLCSILPIGISLVLVEKESVKKIFYAVSLTVIGLSLVLTTYKMLPGKPSAPALSDFNTSWAVAVEALKESPFFGVGPGNYLTAFSRFKPLSYNATKYWAVRFTSGRDFMLTLMTEAGLLAFAAFAILVWKIFLIFKSQLSRVKEGLNSFEIGALASLGICVFLLILFPMSTAVFILLFALLFVSAKTRQISLPLSATNEGGVTSRVPAFIVTLPVIVAILAMGFYGGRALLAEYKYGKALDALARNEGKTTYDTLRQAIGLNPYVDRYHASYTTVNLALARALSQKKDLTDTDKTTIAQLIQQAIREGKSTVTLNPRRSGNWEILARTYQAIIPFAQGADNFAIQSYTQAVALDPTSPNLRIALGGTYYALGKFDDAIRVFEMAVASKPDLANGHYNLGIAYREKGEIENAIAQMNATLSLVNKDSEDYNLVKTELESLQKKLPAKETGGTENLTPPTPAEAPVIKPPLKLPEESTPPSPTP